MSSWFLHWDGKESLESEFSCMPKLGRFCIPLAYDYIWLSLFALSILVALNLELVGDEQQKYWLYYSKKFIIVVHINKVFHKLIQDRVWLVVKILGTWHTTRVHNNDFECWKWDANLIFDSMRKKFFVRQWWVCCLWWWL